VTKPLAPGDRIGRYEIVESLGRGAMGAVYKARDPNLGRTVAVKLLSVGEGWSSDVGQRFRREATASARLAHPNIVSVYDLEVDPDGRYYMVREFVDGESLAAVLRRGPLSEVDAITVATCVCSGLVAAHALQLIHRDIKPSNVLIPQGGFDQAKLSDFGLVGILSLDTGVTRHGEIFGTPYYMSPEQLLGREQDTRTDLYGLGILLYEMLYGRTPFTGENLSQLALQIVNDEVSFPSAPETSPQVRALITNLLQKNASNRLPSSEALLFSLRQLRGQRNESDITQTVRREDVRAPTRPPAQAVAPGTPSPSTKRTTIERRTPRPARPHMGVWILAAIVAGLAVIGLNLLASTLSQSRSVFTANGAAILVGVAISLGGVVISVYVSRWLRNLRPALADDASRILLGAEHRRLMTQSLALDVQQLIAHCRSLDQRILGRSLALVVDQLQHAGSPGDQLQVLSLVVSTMTQLSERLLPWYVRYEKVLAFFVALVGLVTGIITAVRALP
jgi:serine/threonine protein kinase